MTFATIKTHIANYLNRSDLTSYIGTWVNIAQRKIEHGIYYTENGVQHFKNNFKGMEKRSTTTLNEDEYMLTLPPNFKQAIWVKVLKDNRYYDLIPVSPQKALEDYPSFVNDKGRPFEFAVIKYSDEFMIRPTLDATYTFDVYYYAISADLTNDSDTNWLTNTYPEMLIYAALMEAEPFLLNDARVTTWKSMLNDSVAGIARSENETNADPNPTINVNINI